MHEERIVDYFATLTRWMKSGAVRNGDADKLSADSGRPFFSQPELEIPDGIGSVVRFNSVLAISRAIGAQLVIGELSMEKRQTLVQMEAVKAIDHRVQIMDPFGGQPLRMRVDGMGRCTVWSIGPDGVDGQGEGGCSTGPFKSVNASGDLVVGDRTCR
jgi:hypothetical protein